MRQSSSMHRVVAACSLVAALAIPLTAATVSKIDDDVMAPLRGPGVARKIVLTKVPLYAHGTATIELEEFQVWAPGGKVIVHDGKSVQYLDPPPMRFFRGTVNGDPESFAYFSVDGTTGSIQGLMETRDGKFAVSPARRTPGPKQPNRNPDGGGALAGDFDYFLTAADAGDEVPMTGRTWECGVEKLPVVALAQRKVLAETDASGKPVIALGISGTQSYAIAVEVETDTEFFTNAGSNVTTATNYITNLSGAVSTIYNRDIHTNLVQQNLHLYTGGTDPWVATDQNAGLLELGDYYHANHATLKRSSVVMLSGKNIPGGVAWEGVICGGDFSAGGSDFGGSYAWCGGIGQLFSDPPGLGTVPDPNATTNGTLYGMASGIQNYWPLEEYAHELGHNLAGHHTHCVAITPAEALGTNHPSQPFIDMCYTLEGAGCATGPNYSSAPTEKGTIMSYCHNVFVGSVPQSRFTFGQASEVSHHELDDYMLRALGPLAAGETNIVTTTGSFSMSSISGASSVAPNSTGNTATATPVNGGSVTYSWTISGGTITSSSTISSITYTAGASGSVVLRATLYNTNGCGVTDTKTVSITSISPPTNVVATAATATSVTITWTAPGGAAKYHVYRTGNNSTYSQVNGETTVGTSFTDTGAVVAVAANTSYLYKVRAVDGSGNESADSNKDLATTIIFTDDPLLPGVTDAKAVHLTQLRTAVNAVRALGGVSAGTYTDASPTGVLIKKVHIDELRTALTTGRTALGLSTTFTTDPTITALTTLVKAAHFTELRNLVK
jgi:hypothetical protein